MGAIHRYSQGGLYNDSGPNGIFLLRFDLVELILPVLFCLYENSVSPKVDWYANYSQRNNQVQLIGWIVYRAEHLRESSKALENSYFCDLVLAWCVASVETRHWDHGKNAWLNNMIVVSCTVLPCLLWEAVKLYRKTSSFDTSRSDVWRAYANT